MLNVIFKHLVFNSIKGNGKHCIQKYDNLISKTYLSHRFYCSSQPVTEQSIKTALSGAFPKASTIEVADISGGCGAMFEIYVQSSEFAGKRLVQQHQMVNKALQKEIKIMHGLRISTVLPDS